MAPQRADTPLTVLASWMRGSVCVCVCVCLWSNQTLKGQRWASCSSLSLTPGDEYCVCVRNRSFRWMQMQMNASPDRMKGAYHLLSLHIRKKGTACAMWAFIWHGFFLLLVLTKDRAAHGTDLTSCVFTLLSVRPLFTPEPLVNICTFCAHTPCSALRSRSWQPPTSLGEVTIIKDSRSTPLSSERTSGAGLLWLLSTAERHSSSEPESLLHFTSNCKAVIPSCLCIKVKIHCAKLCKSGSL